jgi:hypothetical protein
LSTGLIYLRNRPVRTAYLVDTDYFRSGSIAVRNIFDGIASYSTSNWGARRDSIHCFSGASGLTDEVWFDLEDADPDRIYTFAPLAEAVLDRLHELRPWSINTHPSPIGTDIYLDPSVPVLPGVPMHPTIDLLSKQDNPLLVLTLSYMCATYTPSFLHRNFGSLPQWTDPTQPAIVHRPSWLMELMEGFPHVEFRIGDQDSVNSFFISLAGNLVPKKVYRHPMQVVAPCQIPSLIRPVDMSSWNWNGGFNVYVGDSPELFAAYWADTRTTGYWAEPYKHRLWIPPAMLPTAGFSDALAMYLWQYAGLHSSNSRFISLISDEASFATSETALRAFAQAPHKVHASHHRLKDWEAVRREKRRRDLQAEVLSPRLNSQSATRHRIYESRQTFGIEVPAAVMSPEATWAVEAQVQQDSIDGLGLMDNFLVLPKKRGSDIASSILRRESRVDRLRIMVAKMHLTSGPFDRAARPELTLCQPSPDDFIHYFISGPAAGFDVDDLRNRPRPAQTRDVIYSLSEPGRHLRSVIPLFGDIEASRPFLERKLWSKIFLYLSGSRFRKDETLAAQLQNVFSKRLSCLGAEEAEKLSDGLAGDAIRVVQGRSEDRYLTLQRMRELLDEIAAADGPGPIPLRYGYDGQSVSYAAGVKPLTADELEKDLTYLIERGIFYLGLKLQCPSCAGRQWYPAKSLGQRVECAGCGHSHALPPDPEWSYRLNRLVRRAMGTGTLMVLQALRELAIQTFYSFYFSPSLDVFNGAGRNPAGELDLICLCDGDLVLGECKSGRPKKTELDRFLTRVLELRPDRAIIFISSKYLDEARPLFEAFRVAAGKASVAASLFSLPSY